MVTDSQLVVDLGELLQCVYNSDSLIPLLYNDCNTRLIHIPKKGVVTYHTGIVIPDTICALYKYFQSRVTEFLY